MTLSFITHVLGVGSNLPGLYVNTDTYYRTVEQQGRLTLHMHMLIWIKAALYPAEIRAKLMEPDGQFQQDLISYLKSTHIGEFLTGTMTEIKAKVPYFYQASKGIHDIITDEVPLSIPHKYTDPTQTLPKGPPPLCEDCANLNCSNCAALMGWWGEYRETVDDLILRSNVHTCQNTVPRTDLSKPLKPGAKIKHEVKGCTRKDGSCSARFPWDLFMTTEVDQLDGYINVKKLQLISMQ
ncbi:hypothetical protein B0H10DRAFT_1788709 [Mycena sp. CBHHK59/15]|nr:hypothetical protein B0H10DRAFT_1788709 [Mycena sp. CBHHK59/15]